MSAKRYPKFYGFSAVAFTLLAIGLLAAPVANTQGFSGLGTKAEGFAVPKRGTAFSFPRDHGAHPQYRIEWWYLTANLKNEAGEDLGIQWTLFRSALQPREDGAWGSPQVWMGHAAVTTGENHFVSETLARGGVGLAGAKSAPFSAWINDWRLKSTAASDKDAYSSMEVSASGKDFSYRLNLKADGPLIFHGDKGFSVKSASGQASYYYSQPSYKVTGTIRLDGQDIKVTGTAWLDREWSSQPLASNQKGWDWVSLHFDDGSKLMGFRLRQSDGKHYTSATWIGADNRTQAYSDGVLKMTPLARHEVAGRQVPTQWRIELPERDINVTLDALNPNSWMKTSFPYWEGPVRINGTRRGMGYLEMTGYE